MTEAVFLPRRAALALLLASPLAARAALAFPAPPSFRELVKKVLPAVVAIAVTETVAAAPGGGAVPGLPMPFPGLPERVHAAGSGFLIAPTGIIVTNNHVIRHAASIRVLFGDGTRLPAHVLGADPLTDLAVIKVTPRAPLPFVHWGDSAKMQVGDWILAAGNPFGLGGSVTVGIVSARGRNLGEGPFDNFLQLDAPINPGNSGGPSFDMNGHVVGVNTAIVSPSGGSVGIGFAIPSDLARRVVAQLIAHGRIARGWLGVSIEDMPARDGTPAGVAVAQVVPGGPGAAAGLEPGDVLTAIDGRRVASVLGLIRVVAGLAPGSRASLTLWRSGRRLIVPVLIGERPTGSGN